MSPPLTRNIFLAIAFFLRGEKKTNLRFFFQSGVVRLPTVQSPPIHDILRKLENTQENTFENTTSTATENSFHWKQHRVCSPRLPRNFPNINAQIATCILLEIGCSPNTSVDRVQELIVSKKIHITVNGYRPNHSIECFEFFLHEFA